MPSRYFSHDCEDNDFCRIFPEFSFSASPLQENPGVQKIENPGRKRKIEKDGQGNTPGISADIKTMTGRNSGTENMALFYSEGIEQKIPGYHGQEKIRDRNWRNSGKYDKLDL